MTVKELDSQAVSRRQRPDLYRYSNIGKFYAGDFRCGEESDWDILIKRMEEIVKCFAVGF